MARFDMTGLDELMKDMERKGQLVGEVADQMIAAGAEEVVNAWKTKAAQFTKSRPRAHGDMAASVKSGGSIRGGNVTYAEIAPQGTDRKGVRNAEKAFILHYGKKGYPATHWVDEAEDAAKGPVQQRFEAIWDAFLNS